MVEPAAGFAAAEGTVRTGLVPLPPRDRLIVVVVIVTPALSRVSCFASANAQLYIDEEENSPVFDLNLYKDVVNSESQLCKDQLKYIIMNNTFLYLRFLDASMRVPRGFFGRNLADFGNYYQCLDINEPYDRSRVAGKYCIINVPLSQEFNLPDLSRDIEMLDINATKLRRLRKWMLSEYYFAVDELRRYYHPTNPDAISDQYLGHEILLAACIPQVCTVKAALDALFFNVSSIGLSYRVDYCRLPDDKPWVTADTVALVTFVIIGFFHLMSLIYELFFIFFLKQEVHKANVYYRSFSLYYNTKRLCKSSQCSDYMGCLEGIKILSLMTIISSHVFSYSTSLYRKNAPEMYKSMDWFVATVTTFPMAVDTFYVATGILLVYSTAKKMDGMVLLKNLHIFYLKRLIRMLPLLATAVIFEASIMHRIADGPEWHWIATHAQVCRKYWWSTLLLLQNYINPEEMCVKESWYISLDLQMHFLSPLLLYWLVNGRTESARVAIVVALVSTTVISTIYCIRMELPSHLIEPRRAHEAMKYIKFYYTHIISRISPFLVGMIIGYVMHLWRETEVKIGKILVACLWLITFGTMSLTVYALDCVKQPNWNNHTIDSILNILLRPIWATAVGWIVIACVHGYGGPVNWFLSLSVWRLPNRLSYGIFLFHYPIIAVVESAILAPQFLSTSLNLYKCLAYMMLTFMLSFVLTLLIDMPVNNLFEQLVAKGALKTSRRKRLKQIEVYELELAKE